MRMVFGLVLIIGVGLAGFAVYMAQGYIAQTQAERDLLRAAQASAVPLVDILVVNSPKKYGDPLTPEDVVQIKWQANAVPEGAFTDAAALFPEGAPGTRIVLRALETYEPVLAVKVTEPGEDAGLTSRLTRGMRAFTIQVDVSSGVSGFLRPGDRVDVYWTGTQQGQDVTKLIDSTVRLIAVDQRSDSDQADLAQIARTVTIEATPMQVAALTLAQSTGRLTLALVGSNDDSLFSEVEVNRDQLLGVSAAPVIEVEAEKVCTIRTNKGGQSVETKIPCTN
ncbi:Flp pilus assembly protein CpaB [Frigidibacter sp.]|uniref:Flp pilus assembly protein CpaB n=1 Tax=Frigidibacter sp. TaxID=2586418 RepID=UPI002736FE8C|nr:Flp pilus assembly protein CpaB [Frigidibacter sp.]MDP3338804.1 Flp pilus assembly protein CpaB [Frigidibacter sp.]